MIRAHAINGLYAITPDSTDDHDLLGRTRLVLQGGAGILQYRNKIATPAQRLHQARALRDLTREYDAFFIVNDDAQLAAEVEADGVHLGSEDGGISAARRMLGADKLIGASCYNRAELAREAVISGADYVAFGAFFPSGVKPDAVKAELALLQEMHKELVMPIVAIGGITSTNAPSLINAGANALAVISAVFEATDIKAAAQEFSGLFSRTQTHDFA